MSQQREVLRFILTLRLLNIVSSWIASVWTTWVHLPQIIFSKYYTIYVGWIHRCRMWIWRKRVYGGLTVNSTVARVHALTTPSPLLFKGQLCWTRFLSLYQVINFNSYIELKHIFHFAYFLIDPDSVFRMTSLIYSMFCTYLNWVNISLSLVSLVTLMFLTVYIIVSM